MSTPKKRYFAVQQTGDEIVREALRAARALPDARERAALRTQNAAFAERLKDELRARGVLSSERP